MRRRSINSRLLSNPGGTSAFFGGAQFQDGAWTPGPSSDEMQADGLLLDSVFSDFSASSVVGNLGAAFRQDTQALIDRVVVSRSDTGITALTMRPLVVFRFEIPDYTDLRMFFGFTTSTDNVDPVDSDAPVESYVGVQYSTDRGDTGLRPTTHLEGGGVTLQAPFGDVVVLPTRYYSLSLELTEDLAKFEIAGALGSVIGRRNIATDLPGSDENLVLYAGIQTRSGNARSQILYGANIRHRGVVRGS